MADNGRSTWRRRFNRYVGLTAAVVGVTIVVSAFLFLNDFFWWYITVGLGLLIAVLGFLYGVNPFFTSERRYLSLRAEVDDFIGLVRLLNRAVVAEEGGEALGRLNGKMHESVERMMEKAGKTD